MSAPVAAMANLLGYPLRLAFDCKLRRPGCVLLQAAMGGSSEAASLFPTGSWLLSPTPDLKVYPVRDAAMLSKLIEISAATHTKQPDGGELP